jgi:ribosomal-protein-alanine N-acetyltransferase
MRLPAELTDGVVRLRPWVPFDLDALVAMASDPESARRTRVPEPYTRDDARRFIGQSSVELIEGREASYALCEGAGPPLGSLGVRPERDHARCELGYLLGPAGRGRGLMTRGVVLIAEWLLGPGGFARVAIHVAVDNPASQAVAMRAGFEREGVLRSYHELKGERQDLVSFSRVS